MRRPDRRTPLVAWWAAAPAETNRLGDGDAAEQLFAIKAVLYPAVAGLALGALAGFYLMAARGLGLGSAAAAVATLAGAGLGLVILGSRPLRVEQQSPSRDLPLRNKVLPSCTRAQLRWICFLPLRKHGLVTSRYAAAQILWRERSRLRPPAVGMLPSEDGCYGAVASLWLLKPGLASRTRQRHSLSATPTRATDMRLERYSAELHLRLAVRNGLIVMVLCFALGAILGWVLSHLSTARLGGLVGGAIVIAMAGWSVWVYADTAGLLHMRDRPTKSRTHHE